MDFQRRNFFFAAAAAAAMGRGTLRAGAAPAGRTRLGLLRSDNSWLRRPVNVEDPLDYGRVKDMVWKAIEYGKPRAGSLDAKIRPGSWVVIKPNIVGLRPTGFYRTGDVTDFRVTKAVLEYVAQHTRAGRVTVAEGGSYRRLSDPAEDNVCFQNGVRVDARTFDWGHEEFPGFAGTLSDLIREVQSCYPDKHFDYVDLSYDAVRDVRGEFRRIEVPKAVNGVGAFGARPDYYVTNTITGCDFLISVPVMKVHLQCGITCCLKNYVGTAPRQAYAMPGQFYNANLHAQHSVEDRIDAFIADLAAFHPPDYVVVDALRGLQYMEHSNGMADQLVRTNAVIAGEDPVAADALAARMMGFNETDIEFLQMAEARGMGTLNLANVDVLGEEPDRISRKWAKPKGWHGRGNREWRVTMDLEAPQASWARYTAPTDTLHFDQWAGKPAATGMKFGAMTTVKAEGSRKAYMWVGARGKVRAILNGEAVLDAENRTRYRIGQFQQAIELKSGENRLVLEVESVRDAADVSALLVGPANDGDTVSGIRWLG